MKSFILRATYKDETRNITFAEDGNWPSYGEIQAKVSLSCADPWTGIEFAFVRRGGERRGVDIMLVVFLVLIVENDVRTSWCDVLVLVACE